MPVNTLHISLHFAFIYIFLPIFSTFPFTCHSFMKLQFSSHIWLRMSFKFTQNKQTKPFWPRKIFASIEAKPLLTRARTNTEIKYVIIVRWLWNNRETQNSFIALIGGLKTQNYNKTYESIGPRIKYQITNAPSALKRMCALSPVKFQL